MIKLLGLITNYYLPYVKSALKIRQKFTNYQNKTSIFVYLPRHCEWNTFYFLMLQNKYQSEKNFPSWQQKNKQKLSEPFFSLFPILGLKIYCWLVWPFFSAVE